MKVCFGSKNFTTGVNVIFEVFDIQGNKLITIPGIEIGTTGVYYIDCTTLQRGIEYLVLGYEVSNPDKTKDYKFINKVGVIL